MLFKKISADRRESFHRVSPIFKATFANYAGHLTAVAGIIQFILFLGLTLGCSILMYWIF